MILAVIQARATSTRLPRKVLRPLLGEPMLYRQFERIKSSKILNDIIIATSSEPSDDEIEDLCGKIGVGCFRGSLEDVLDRFYKAAKILVPEQVVRLTGDCPLTDPELLDDIIAYHVQGGYDYTSNTIEPTYPDGLDIEVMKFATLKAAWSLTKLRSQREHVTPFIYQNPGSFKIGSYKNTVDLSYLRWTVDEQLDFELISDIYAALYKTNSAFNTAGILEYLSKNPQLLHKNTKYKRNEGYEKTLKNDA